MGKVSIWKEFFGALVKSTKSQKEEVVEYLTFNEATLNYYLKHVKGNENLTEDQARRKMTRNMNLAIPYKRDSEAKKHPRVWYSYSCLRFIVKDNKIIWIQNKLPRFKCWYKDYEKYEILNKKYGIEI